MTNLQWFMVGVITTPAATAFVGGLSLYVSHYLDPETREICCQKRLNKRRNNEKRLEERAIKEVLLRSGMVSADGVIRRLIRRLQDRS